MAPALNLSLHFTKKLLMTRTVTLLTMFLLNMLHREIQCESHECHEGTLAFASVRKTGTGRAYSLAGYLAASGATGSTPIVGICTKVKPSIPPLSFGFFCIYRDVTEVVPLLPFRPAVTILSRCYRSVPLLPLPLPVTSGCGLPVFYDL